MDVIIYRHPISAMSTPMRITGDLPEEGVSGGQRSHSRLQEMVPLIDAPEATGFDFGNAQSVEQFAVTRSHSDPGAASYYYDSHPPQVSGRGDVEFVHRTSTGAIHSRTRHNDCNILCTGGEWSGCSTTMQYTITWGG